MAVQKCVTRAVGETGSVSGSPFSPLSPQSFAEAAFCRKMIKHAAMNTSSTADAT